MLTRHKSRILVENHSLSSAFLLRDVRIDFYLPSVAEGISSNTHLLLINDGQNMEELGLKEILDRLYAENNIQPVCCVAIHAGAGRKMEYGIASQADYMGRGAKAGVYTSFVLEELLPFLYSQFPDLRYSQKSFAGFSLGGLSALDIAWHHSDVFSCVAVFSGSLWWRSMPQ
jgi:enterochelin esterase-like enzyme